MMPVTSRDALFRIFFKLSVALSVGVALSLGCSGDTDDGGTEQIDTKVVSVKIDEVSGVFAFGHLTDRYPLTARAFNANNEEVVVNSLVWSSSEENVARVNAEGLVQPIGEGNVRITASIGDVKGQVDLVLQMKPREAFATGGTLALLHVNVIPMTENVVLEDYTVIVENGVITQMGPFAEITIPTRAEELDLSGKYLMPGMADMHTHIGTNVTESGAGRNTALWDLTSKGQLLSYAANGVTTVLNNGDFGEPINSWKEDVLENRYPGPAIYAAAWARGPNDGNALGRDLTSPQEAIDFIRGIKSGGYDFVKLYSGTPDFSVGPMLSEARNQGMGRVGHFPFQVGSSDALSMGMDLVAHAEAYYWDFFAFQIKDSEIPAAVNFTKANGTYISTTLGLSKTLSEAWCNDVEGINRLLSRPSLAYEHRPTSVQIWLNGLNGNRWNPAGCSIGQYTPVHDFVKRYTRAFYDAGIPLVIGTDSPTVLGVAGFSMHREFEVLSDMGINNYEILKMATSNAGDFIRSQLFSPLDFGKIAVGFRADLMVLDQNPLENLENLKRPAGVMLRGNWYTRDYFDQELEKLRIAYGN
ncbi:MAG: amidohydrolase family protein [Roseivirga sp.]|nr:amidohydrolase family protein [Roseivirga sp.]